MRMFGSMFRGLLAFGVVMLIAMALLAMVKVAVMLVVFAITLLVPAALIYWILSQAARGWRVPLPRGARRAERRFRAEERQAARQADPEQWKREAASLAADIARLVRRSDRQTRGILASAPGSARKLAGRVSELSRLCKALEEHLRQNDRAGYLRQAAEMQARADSAADPFARDQYREAAQSLEGQAQTCSELTRTRERLHAEIARILAALTNLRSRIVAVLSSPATGGESAARAADELADLESQVGTFQESVRQVLRQVPQQTR